jgi:hypothetical protein
VDVVPAPVGLEDVYAQLFTLDALHFVADIANTFQAEIDQVCSSVLCALFDLFASGL